MIHTLYKQATHYLSHPFLGHIPSAWPSMSHHRDPQKQSFQGQHTCHLTMQKGCLGLPLVVKPCFQCKKFGFLGWTNLFGSLGIRESTPFHRWRMRQFFFDNFFSLDHGFCLHARVSLHGLLLDPGAVLQSLSLDGHFIFYFWPLWPALSFLECLWSWHCSDGRFIAFTGPARGRRPGQSRIPIASLCAVPRGTHQSTLHDC